MNEGGVTMTPQTSRAGKGRAKKPVAKRKSRPAAKSSKNAPRKTAKKPVKRASKKSVKKDRKKGGKRKGLIITLVVLAVLIAVVIGYLLTNLNFLVKSAIEKYGSQATQTAVRVKGVRISLKDGSGSIQGLTVGNPKGFDLPHAFSLGEIGVDINLKSLTTDEIGIDEIIVRSPEIFVEVNAEKKNNLMEIKNNLPSGTGGESAKKAPEKKGDKGKETRLFIRRILFAEAQVTAIVVPMDNKEYRFKMGAIEMRDLRGTPGQIAVQVLNRLTQQALAEVKKKGVGQAVDQLGDKAKSQVEDQTKKAADRLKRGLNR